MLATSQIYDMAAQQPQKNHSPRGRQHGAAICHQWIWDPLTARRGIALVDLSSKAKVR